MLRPLLILGKDGKVRGAYRDSKTGKIISLPESDAKTVQEKYITFRYTIRKLMQESDSNNVIDISKWKR